MEIHAKIFLYLISVMDYKLTCETVKGEARDILSQIHVRPQPSVQNPQASIGIAKKSNTVYR